MTQIVGVVYRGLAFQGSDRRLSNSVDLAPISDRASKSIVVATRDAISLVGYTGLAEVPTASFGTVQMDSFLAGACCHDPGWPWMPPVHENDLGRLNMGQVVNRMTNWLTLLREGLGPAGSLLEHQMVQVIGFRRDRKLRPNPYSFVIFWDADQQGFKYKNERLIHAQLESPQVTLTPARESNTRNRVTSFLRDFVASPPDLMAGLFRTMTGFSQMPGVGGDYLMLCLEPLEYRVHTYFVSASGEMPVVETPKGDIQVQPTPWLVMPNLAQRPSLTNMALLGREGDLCFELHGLPESATAFIALPLERFHVVGPQRLKLPTDVVMSQFSAEAGRHTLEMRGRSDPSSRL